MIIKTTTDYLNSLRGYTVKVVTTSNTYEGLLSNVSDDMVSVTSDRVYGIKKEHLLDIIIPWQP